MRNLLTDIGPKKEWAETDPDVMKRDGIMLPPRGASSGQGGFLMSAETPDEEEEPIVDGRQARRSAVCKMCKCKPSSYTCPRCNLNYCSLTCYQSPDHSVCAEIFYKESVLQELKDMGTTEEEGRKKMQEMLVRLRQKAERTDGGMESLLKEAGIVSYDTGDMELETAEKVQAVDLLSRLAELQQSGEENPTEIDAILRKLEEIGEGQLFGDRDEDTESLEGEVDLANRLLGLDIDKLSEDELWELLSNKEKETFMGLVKGGGLARLVTLWRPWWEEHEEGGSTLVEMLDEKLCNVESENSTITDELETDKVKIPEVVYNPDKSAKMAKGGKQSSKSKQSSIVSSVPPVSAKIPNLKSLCTKPSPLVCYGLVNALYAYTFSLCLINNDTDSLMFEFCDMVLALSEVLNSNRVFNTIQEALDSGESLIFGGGYLDKEDPLASSRALEAVAHILTGRDAKDATGYCLAALSQLRSVLSEARKALSKEGEEGERRQKYFLANKKCEFFQAWALDNSHQIRRLAVELWIEHGKRERVRSNTEKAKTVVEENSAKGKNKNGLMLIEELG